MTTERRPLADTGIPISPVAMGCWPIAGMTSLNVNEADSLATLEAAVEAGINFFDTAYCYGRRRRKRAADRPGAGPSPRRDRDRHQGRHPLGPAGQPRVCDARPETLRRQCDESLRRLQTDRVELLYLHAPDPQTPLAESAGALRDLLDGRQDPLRGRCRT